MKRKISIERLLRWRLKRGEGEAPPAPKAARLLELALPWWEQQPEKYHSLVNRLSQIQIAGGHAKSGSHRIGDWNPVPALVVRGEEVAENYARVQEFQFQKTRLCMRFQMEKATTPIVPAFDVTFISDTTTRPLFCAEGTALPDSGYRIDTHPPVEIARDWGKLTLADPMPFWLILCSNPQV